MNIKNLQKSGDNTPAVKFVRRDPKLAAALSKSVKDDRTAGSFGDNNKLNDNLVYSSLHSISSKRARRNSDAQAVLKLLPDIALAKLILTSCVLSPKDMMSTELRFLLPKNLLSPELASSVLNILNTYFVDKYDIKKYLSTILEEALFDKGSYPVAVLPESAIDDFINGKTSLSTENFRTLVTSDGKTFRPIGLLGSPKEVNNSVIQKISLENFSTKNIYESVDNNLMYDLSEIETIDERERYKAEPFVSVTDNFSLLSLPKLASMKLIDDIESIYSKHSSGKSNISTESLNLDKLKNKDLDNLLIRNRHFKSEQVASIRSELELNRKSIGEPLIMKLPTESVIPVHAPGDVRKQVGFFIILDQDGNPVEMPDGDHDYSNLSNTGGNGVISSNIIKRIGANFNENNFVFNNQDQRHTSEAARIYGKIIEKDLINRLKNGVYNSNYEIAGNEEIYRLMLSRTLAKKYTQLLYIPVEYLTYIAFKYSDDGLGKSLLDEAMTINTLRTVIMFSDLIGQIKNAIGRTRVTVNVPTNDPNPMKTIEKIMDDVVRVRTTNFPMTISNPNDIVEYLQRAGIEWQFEGHPGLPDLKIDYEQINSNYAKVDNELSENLKDASINHMGLTPEVVNNGLNQPDFATTIVANNVLLSKRVSIIQDTFTPQLSDHLRKVAKNSQSLNDSIKELITNSISKIKLKLEDFIDEETLKQLPEEAKDKILASKVINEIINGFYVELPKPDSVTLENQMQDLNNYLDGLDKVLDVYISDELFTPETSGDISNQISTIRNQLRAYYARKWLSDKGIFTEIAEIVGSDEDGKPLMDYPEIIKAHMETLSHTGINILTALKKVLDKTNKTIESKLGELNEEQVDSTTTDSSTSDTGSNSDDDFDLGLDDTISTTDEFTSTNDETTSESTTDEDSKGETEGNEEDSFKEPNTDLPE